MRSLLVLTGLALLACLGWFAANSIRPGSAAAAEKKARTSVAAPAGPADRPELGFAKDGVAFLQKHCVSCHGAKTKRADVVLHNISDDATLLKNRKLLETV